VAYHEIDIDNWPRKSTFEFFRDYRDPFFNITANVEVTETYTFCRGHGLSFSLVALYSSLLAANAVPELRQRLVDGKIVEFDRVHATQTILNDDETFSFSYYELKPTVREFESSGRESREKYKSLKTFDVESERRDLIYYSVIPWVTFTSFKHASRLDNTQTVPRIVFGKIAESDGARSMPVSVEVHHALVDGVHVGKFFQKLQEWLDHPDHQ
jgi:chloramphenicol O-acetyltransferase type A